MSHTKWMKTPLLLALGAMLLGPACADMDGDGLEDPAGSEGEAEDDLVELEGVDPEQLDELEGVEIDNPTLLAATACTAPVPTVGFTCPWTFATAFSVGVMKCWKSIPVEQYNPICIFPYAEEYHNGRDECVAGVLRYTQFCSPGYSQVDASSSNNADRCRKGGGSEYALPGSCSGTASSGIRCRAGDRTTFEDGRLWCDRDEPGADPILPDCAGGERIVKENKDSCPTQTLACNDTPAIQRFLRYQTDLDETDNIDYCIVQQYRNPVVPN